tara:strand:+ start:4555 stop:4833 length:279 start_codon:yes stop_codon:yes gene_type:complete
VGAVDCILAEATLRWRRRVFLSVRLNVSARVSLLGCKRLVMDYRVDSQEGERLVSGAAVQVMYYYLAALSKRLLVGMRDSVIAHERLFDRGG